MKNEQPDPRAEVEASELEQLRADLASVTQERKELKQKAQALESDLAAQARHFCSSCHHRWDGPLKGAELCGDCWRKHQQDLARVTQERDEAAQLAKSMELARDRAMDERNSLTADLARVTDQGREYANELNEICSLLETAKSDAPTRREAIRERIASLARVTDALRSLQQQWRKEAAHFNTVATDDDTGGMWSYQHEASGKSAVYEACAGELEAALTGSRAPETTPETKT